MTIFSVPLTPTFSPAQASLPSPRPAVPIYEVSVGDEWSDPALVRVLS